MPGRRVLKIEWKNAGIYEEYYDDKVSNDYINFQLWLYEGTNDIGSQRPPWETGAQGLQHVAAQQKAPHGTKSTPCPHQ